MLLDSKIILGLAMLFLFSAIDAKADAIHDPTLPKLSVMPNSGSNSTAQNGASAVLQGIVKKRNSRMAIISGQLTQVGDEVDGYKVSQINNNNVVLIKAGSQKRLYVYEK